MLQCLTPLSTSFFLMTRLYQLQFALYFIYNLIWGRVHAYYLRYSIIIAVHVGDVVKTVLIAMTTA